MKINLQDIREDLQTSFKSKGKSRRRLSKSHYIYSSGSGTTDFSYNGKSVRVWVPNAQNDYDLVDSVKKLTKLPDVHPYIVVMPDYHKMGLFVNGSVIPSRDTLYVQAIGGDIGCGFSLAKLPVKKEDLPFDLKQLYKSMNSKIPSGRRSKSTIEDRVDSHPLFDFESSIVNKAVIKKAKMQFGSIGDGNHFAELLTDNSGQVYSLVHTGSRGLGQIISGVFLRDSDVVRLPHEIHTLKASSIKGGEYLKHVDFAQKYAEANRKEIQRQVLLALKYVSPNYEQVSFDSLLGETIDLSHNNITKQNLFGDLVYVHRKGATYTPQNSFGIIAGSMGTPTFLVRGRGNKDSFNSCSHGAGRALSRGKARDKISESDLRESTKDVVCRQDGNVVDEAPQAYKDVRKVLKSQKKLVRIQSELNPFLNIRG